MADADAGAPMLLRRQTGRVGALVLLGIFVLFPVGTAAVTIFGVDAMRGWRGVVATAKFALVVTPFLVGAVVVWLSRSELTLDPVARVLRHVSFRPWRRPRTTDVPLGSFAGVRADGPERDVGNRYVVSLVAVDGDELSVRAFRAPGEAEAFAGEIARVSGLWVRSGVKPVADPEPAG
jgi:hypothetical protein